MKHFKDYLKTELTESEVKFQALEEMKAIQTTLGSISFISVISVMKEDNPLKGQIHEFENQLHELTVGVSKFINDNLKDAVDVTDEEREANVDNAVKDAEDEAKVAKKAPKED